MNALPIYQGLEEGEEHHFAKYVESVVSIARKGWADGLTDFVVAINAKTDRIILVDRQKAIEVIAEDMGTNKISEAIGSPAGPMSVWVLMIFKDGDSNVNIMKMTFMASSAKVGQA